MSTGLEGRTGVRAGSAANWTWFMDRVRDSVGTAREPSVTAEARLRADPFRVLVATVISLRTRDEVTAAAAERLFAIASTPEEIAAIGPEAVSAAIRPANYYPTKAARIVEISRILIESSDGRVPSDYGKLMALPGVGPKTANLVLSEGFGIDAICVDTHVHRIPNRFGIIRTADPQETEKVMRETLPVEFWKEINRLLVPFGQTTCTPVSPRCSVCPLSERCARRFQGPSR